LTLEHARLMLTVDLTEDAGRAAYLAGYEAAEAFIFEHTGKVTKTHRGAHTEFARLSASERHIDAQLRRFLPQALQSVRKLPVFTQRGVPSSSFPRKRESRPAAPSRGGLDPRFRGGDAILLERLGFFPDRHLQ
jgi:hypothetical protein